MRPLRSDDPIGTTVYLYGVQAYSHELLFRWDRWATIVGGDGCHPLTVLIKHLYVPDEGLPV